MSRIQQTVLTLAVAAGLSLSSGSAFALDSPFGPNLAVEARVGSVVSGPIQDQGQWVVWKRRDNGQCFKQLIGNTLGFFANVTVNGTGLGDLLISQGQVESIACNGANVPLGVPTTGVVFELVFDGRGGDDAILAGFPTKRIFGGSGNDIVAGSGVIIPPEIHGGTGNDQVESYGFANNEQLFGEGGNDCLWDQNAASGVVNCGGALDFDRAKSVIRPPFVLPVGCEVISPSVCCNFAHLIGAC